MITASEALANVELVMKKREEDLLYSATCWIENVLNCKIIAASKRGELFLEEEINQYASETETLGVANCVVRELTERYGFKAELVGKLIRVMWGKTE